MLDLATSDFEFSNLKKNVDREKFQLICVDPPGFGKSWPPNKVLKDWHKSDAEAILKLMVNLGITKFSVLGFSDGGRTAIWLAVQHQDYVDKLIISSCNAYFTMTEKRKMIAVRNINDWNSSRREMYMKIYGDQLQSVWSQYLDAVINTFIPRSVFNQITSKTLILHGENDLMAPKQHAHFIKNNIKNSKLIIFANASHIIPQENPKEFNFHIEKFLSSDD